MPSAQPSSVLTNVADDGTNDAGTGPPAGPTAGAPELEPVLAGALVGWVPRDGLRVAELARDVPVGLAVVADAAADELVCDELVAGAVVVAEPVPPDDDVQAAVAATAITPATIEVVMCRYEPIST